jgi:hypothetical protein
MAAHLARRHTSTPRAKRADLDDRTRGDECALLVTPLTQRQPELRASDAHAALTSSQQLDDRA